MRKAARLVGVIGFDGVNALDIVGPLEAFTSASIVSAKDARADRPYEVNIIGLSRRPFTAESGIRLLADHCLEDAPAVDTLIVPGGPGLREVSTNATVAAWLRKHAPRTRRVASVCTGIYGLAATGLLDGRRATTHWRFAADVARRFPRVRLNADALFLKDGRYYTAAGVTAGIDLALALIEEDLGPRTALAAARELVVYLKRPGGQEQYSEPLKFQVRSLDTFADLVAWIHAHLDRDLGVECLAARACMSPRHFTRRFVAALGCTPAVYVESARLREARDRLTSTGQSVEEVASSLGFRSADVFRRRFAHHFGIAPSIYRDRFASTAHRPGPPSYVHAT
jgi:transcriptional regulator GlxA family with amidase domain